MKGVKGNLVMMGIVMSSLFGLAGCGGDTAAFPTATTGVSSTATSVTEAATSTTEAATSTPAGGTWETFASSEGKFSVSMPGKPEETSSVSETAVGPITQHLFQYSKDGPEFAVAYADYPAETSEVDAAKLLEDTIKGAAQGSTVENQQASTMQGNASVTGEWKAGEFNYTWYKAVLVEDRLYQVITATSNANKDKFEADAKKFLDSFQLNP